MPYNCLHQEGVNSFAALYETAQKNNFSVVATSINGFNPALREPQKKLTYSDLIHDADFWNTKILLILNDHSDCDSDNEIRRNKAVADLLSEISWADHLQSAGFVMLRLRSGNCLQLARYTTRKIKGMLLVQIPLYSKKVASLAWRKDIPEEELELAEKEDTWKWWNRFRLGADFNQKVRVVLELNENDCPDREVVRRWLGEPIEALQIPASMFIWNRQNYPVLPKTWQNVIAEFANIHVNVIISTGVHDCGLRNYSDYMQHFWERHNDVHPLQSFEDILEIPLQPLYDNLDCYTYEVFEKDPVKYKFYQQAIEQALLDRVSDFECDNKLTIIMVLGAGRGPLVRAAFNAAEITKRKVRVYIIEKNPNAITTLSAMIETLWKDKDVFIFSKDMRDFTPPEKADILVSELLGSFSDNELSPECLDCAQKILKPDGISIPMKSSSYINPIMSSKLYNAVRNLARPEAFETGYVTLPKNVFHIDAQQMLFQFVHPNPEDPPNNSRYKTLVFKASMDSVIHGFCGYFDMELYKDIKLSITPQTHTPGMFSWFPFFFPLITPVYVTKGTKIEIAFWRCVSRQKVWYEWRLTEPTISPIHNIDGRGYAILC